MGAGAKRPNGRGAERNEQPGAAKRPVELVSATTGEVLVTLSLSESSSLKDVKAT